MDSNQRYLSPYCLTRSRSFRSANARGTLIAGDDPARSVVDRNGKVHGLANLNVADGLQGRMPVWRHAVGCWTLEARVWMEPGEHTTYLAYRLSGSGSGAETPKLRVRLLVNARDHHGAARAAEFDPRIETRPAKLDVVFPDQFTLHFLTQGGDIAKRMYWIEDFDLPVERERGLPDRDNHLCVGEALARRCRSRGCSPSSASRRNTS